MKMNKIFLAVVLILCISINSCIIRSMNNFHKYKNEVFENDTIRCMIPLFKVTDENFLNVLDSMVIESNASIKKDRCSFLNFYILSPQSLNNQFMSIDITLSRARGFCFTDYIMFSKVNWGGFYFNDNLFLIPYDINGKNLPFGYFTDSLTRVSYCETTCLPGYKLGSLTYSKTNIRYYIEIKEIQYIKFDP